MTRAGKKTLTLAVLVTIMAGAVPAQASNWDEWGRHAHGGLFDRDSHLLIDEDISGSYFAGGYAHDNGTFAHAAVENDSISITNGTITLVEGSQPPYVFNGPEVVGGTGTGLAQNNNVTVSGNGKIYGGNVSAAGIYGGRSSWDRAVNNRVSITDHGALVQIYEVTGGASGAKGETNSDVSDNYVSFDSDGQSEVRYIYGGNALEVANHNGVSITNGVLTAENIIGGFSSYWDALRNYVWIGENAELHIDTGTIIGGKGETAHQNQVSIQDSKIEKCWYMTGAISNNVTNNNRFSLQGIASVSSLGIAGGFSWAEDSLKAEAKENIVSIDPEASATAVVIGGGAGPNATKNILALDGTVHAYLLGGGGAYDPQNYFSSEHAEANGNVVNLAGAKLVPIKLDDPLLKEYTEDEDYKPYIDWLKKAGDSLYVTGGALLVGGKAQDNMVNLSGTMDLSQANLYGWITGPEILEDSSKLEELIGEHLDNSVDHSGNTLNVGYTAELSTDEDGNAAITGKAADWHGSKIQGIYNFDKIAFYNVDHSQTALTVTDTVSLPDTVTLDLDHFTPSSSPDDSVIKDDVLIDASGATTVKGLDKLYASGKDKYQQPVTRTYANGGVTVMGKDGLALSADNKLYYGLHSLDNITYNTIDWQTDGTVLTLADSQKFDLANTKVHTENIGFTAKSLERITKAGDYSMTLLDTQGNKTLAAGNLTTKQGKWNISNALEGTGVASLDANGNVIYTMDTVEKPQEPNKPAIKVQAAEETHNVLIANEAGLSILAVGRDRLDSVLTNFNGQEGGVFTFASLGGSKDTYDTGSESKTYTWNGLVGVGNEAATKDGDFSYGLFYEYGKGHYRVDGAGYAGSGDAHCNGGGLMAKYMARNKNYVEGSLHFGNLKNNADSVLHSSDGSAYGYNTSSNYWSGHVGFGHIFDLTDKVESTSLGGTQRAARDLDVYGKYFYTHVGGDSFRAGEANYQLDGMNSSLLRIGARLNNRSGWNNYYYGLAWDHEFDGESNGTVSAAGLSAPIRKADIGGSSLMAEAGWKLESNQENPWEVNLSMQAYAGQHKGLGGNVYMAYHF